MKNGRVVAIRPNKIIYQVDAYMVKVFDEHYTKADVLNEALNHARVEETGLRIPRLHEVTKIDGKWAIYSDFIEGKPLSQLMEEAPGLREDFLGLLVELQMQVHAQRAPHLNRLKEKIRTRIAMAHLDEDTRYDLLTRLESMPKHDKVCHGDFNPSNIIIRPDGTPYIIDWAHATQGNASADAARTYMLFCLAGEAENAEAYLEAFSEASRTEKRYIQNWLSLVAASRLAKEVPEERAFLLRWIGVVG